MLKQYSRRQCLRIEGILKQIKEKTDVINLIKKCFAEPYVDIPDTVSKRAHRINPVCEDDPEKL